MPFMNGLSPSDIKINSWSALLDIEKQERVEAIIIFPVVVVAIMLQSLLEVTKPVLLSLAGTTGSSNLCKQLFLLVLNFFNRFLNCFSLAGPQINAKVDKLRILFD